MSQQNLFGFLNVNKPGGKTAHDVVAIVRRLAKIKQVGHGGTLDPMATGVLPVAIGKACRLLRFIEGRKIYLAEIRLGQRTTTDDIEGDTIGVADSSTVPDEATVVAELPKFIGAVLQVPPLYSAIHVGGKRLYELARAGQEVENIPTRTVEIDSIEVVAFDHPVLTVRITCGGGTYIRSIARDLGDVLGCGGCLQKLSREQSGPFVIGKSHTIEALQLAVETNTLADLIEPPHTVLLIPRFIVSDEQVERLRKGQAIRLDAPEDANTYKEDGSALAVKDQNSIAICRSSRDESDSSIRMQPEVVLV